MTTPILCFTSLALLLAVVAFVRERRLRRALQELLQRLLVGRRSDFDELMLDEGRCPGGGPDGRRV